MFGLLLVFLVLCLCSPLSTLLGLHTPATELLSLSGLFVHPSVFPGHFPSLHVSYGADFSVSGHLSLTVTSLDMRQPPLHPGARSWTSVVEWSGEFSPRSSRSPRAGVGHGLGHENWHPRSTSYVPGPTLVLCFHRHLKQSSEEGMLVSLCALGGRGASPRLSNRSGRARTPIWESLTREQ